MNGLEKQMAAILRRLGLHYRSQFKPGGGVFPVDFIIPALKIIIEVDGCYWHGCEKCGFTDWASRAAPDSEKVKRLKKLGFWVFRFWEHQIADGSAERILRRALLLHRLKGMWPVAVAMATNPVTLGFLIGLAGELLRRQAFKQCVKVATRTAGPIVGEGFTVRF